MGMTRYLISFDDGAMTFPEQELPDVAKAEHAVVEEAKDAVVWVFAGGLEASRRASWPRTGRSPTARTRTDPRLRLNRLWEPALCSTRKRRTY